MEDATVMLPSTSYFYTGEEITPEVTVIVKGTKLIAGQDFTVAYADNREIGTAVITITGCNDPYTGILSTHFTIQAKNLNNCQISGIETKTYTGKALTQDIVVTDGAKILVPEQEYRIEYTENTEVGTGRVVLHGIGAYSGTVTKTFTISAIPLHRCIMSGIMDKLYTGSSVTQSITVLDGAKQLTLGKDYELEYANNIAIGKATMTVVGIGHYRGSVNQSFQILPLSTEHWTISGIQDKTATGDPITQSITIKDGNTVLKMEEDYTISYTNNVKVGTATITITGQGKYAGGKLTKNFTINAASAQNWSITGVQNKAYTGKAITQAITVQDGGATLQSGTDYKLAYENNTKVGTATMTLTGLGKYAGSTRTVTFQITGTTLQKKMVTAIPNQLYTGKAITPALTVKDGSNTLKKGTDYTVEFQNNTQAGTATAVLTGTGKYTGTVQVNFIIYKEQISKMQVSAIANQTYTGSAIQPKLTVKHGATVLKEKTDYVLSYKNNQVVGTATVTIQGKGQYQGTVKKTFQIKPRSNTGLTYSTIATQAYSGKAKTPSVTVKYGKKILKNKVDYTVKYQNNVKLGTAKAVITFKGNYKGSKTISFKIALQAPQGMKISNTASGVQLSWKKVTGAKQYVVYRKTSSGKFTKLATLSSSKTKYVDTKAKSGTSYTYYLKAVNGKQSSSASAKVSIRYLSRVKISKLQNTQKKVVTLQWNKVTGAKGYYIYRKEGNGAYKKIKTITKASTVKYSDKSVKKGKKYTYYVRAYNGKTVSAFTSKAITVKK